MVRMWTLKIIFKNLCYVTLRWTRNCTPQKESHVFFDSSWVVQGSIRRRLRTIRTRCWDILRTEQEIVCFSLVFTNSSIFRVSFYVTEKRLKDTFLGWIKRLKTLWTGRLQNQSERKGFQNQSETKTSFQKTNWLTFVCSYSFCDGLHHNSCCHRRCSTFFRILEPHDI